MLHQENNQWQGGVMQPNANRSYCYHQEMEFYFSFNTAFCQWIFFFYYWTAQFAHYPFIQLLNVIYIMNSTEFIIDFY